MKSLFKPLLAALAALLFIGAAAVPAQAAPRFRVLVFSKTTFFTHSSIPAGKAAIQKLGVDHNFEVVVSDDAAQFTDANLATFDAIVFNNTNSNIGSPALLDANQRLALQKFIRAGGGYAGLHAATASERDWAWYEGLVGTIFDFHPDYNSTGGTYPGRIKVVDRAHPSTKNLPELWERSEEWYNWKTNPTGKVHTLAQIKLRDGITGNLDEGVDHAYSWCQNYDGGRSWYTAGGHDPKSFDEPAFLEHLRYGIEWAAGAVEGDCSATKTGSFQRTTLVGQDLADPFELAVAPDRKVYYIQRTGKVKVIDQSTLAATTLLDFAYTPEMTSQSDGLIGMTLDKDFATNGWIYLLWSDKTLKQLNLSRFTVANNAIAMTSEKRLLTIPTYRGVGRANSHMGGSITMDKSGNLYAAIGDNTDPFESSGFTPIDERAGRGAWDAQGTSGNTNDLRGKILRITPKADGTYSIPAGNLFAPGTAKTKPEIYAMGMRNPFRVTIDPHTNAVLVGDYGPDARTADPNRGPEGTVEYNRITSAGNYGWPYCIGNNTPFNDYDFATGVSGAKFNCAAPVNNSPNNTGLTTLPAAKPALVWHAYSASAQFPEVGTGGGGPMSGPMYDYDPNNPRVTKFPEYFDGKWVIYELTRKWFKTLSIHKTAQTFTNSRFGATNVGDLQSINGVFSDMSWIQPIEAEYGPDGSLYVIDFGAGTGSGRGGSNEGAGIYRIDYVANGTPATAKVTASKDSGAAPLTVAFSSAGSTGSNLSYAWDFDGNGTVDSTSANPTHTYSTNGRFNARLTVSNSVGSGVAAVEITVGNTRPTVAINIPNGGFFDFGDKIPYTVTVTDPEDGTAIDCSKVVVQTLLGHDDHAHPLDNYTGCSGVVTTDANAGDGHGPGQNLYARISAQYTDKGATGVPVLVGSTQVELQTKDKEAEHFDEQSGVTVFDRPTARAGKRLGDVDHGDWLRFAPANLKSINSVTVGVSSGGPGGDIEFRKDSPTGTLLGKATVPSTGSWDNLISPTIPLSGAGTAQFALYVVFNNPTPAAGTDLMSFDWLRFNGAGVKQESGSTHSSTATPSTGVAPLTVNFTATATPAAGRTIIDQTWNFGDNTADVHTLNTSHVYSRKGTYTARLTTRDSTGQTYTSTHVISVT
ncbi:ThuA domain-containing protein [Actinokineospora sp. HUAS TT18]|uniref:ThuA domain-containing protein n=1 Tax=Actinokineospora sp. HUAS TT18 TaxID=3447451 RepID=UPI003F51F5FF